MTKHALVTGASRGIGRAICIQLARDGYTLLINYLSRKDEAEETLRLVRELGATGELLAFDVCNAEESKRALDNWARQHPNEHIEVLVNNAGIRRDNLLLWMEPNEWHSVIATSLDAFYNVSQPLLTKMLSKRCGRIVNMVSLSGIKGMPGQCNYAAAKGGLIAATKSLALELAKKKVTVNAVAPGFIRTDMTEDLDEKELSKQVPMGRFGLPEEVAQLVSFLVSPEAAYITGEVISINGGMYT